MSNYPPDLVDLYNCLLPKPETFTAHAELKAEHSYFQNWSTHIKFGTFLNSPLPFLSEFKKKMFLHSINLDEITQGDPLSISRKSSKFEIIIFVPISLSEDLDECFIDSIEKGKKMLSDSLIEYPDSQSQIKTEGYYLYCGYRCTTLISYSKHGIYNGLQTLLQIARYFSVNGFTSDISEFSIFDFPRLTMRGFHLDLKELLPTFEYTTNFIDLLGHYKYNCLLLEYEDKFPYSGPLSSIPHKLSWTQTQVEKIIELCDSNFIEIIPLVQVFGHVERYLQKEPFKHLAEGVSVGNISEETSCFCPLNPESLTFAKEMISQMIKAHPNAQYLHLGADEVYNLGNCAKCKEYVVQNSKSALYIGFLNKLISIVLEFGKIPIIWDDYIQKYPEELNQLDSKTVMMYWGYSSWREGPIMHAKPQDSEEYDPIMPYFQFYSDKGFDVIGAPSTSSDFDLFLPGLKKRIDNVAIHCLKAKQSGINKVIITSWSVCGNPLDVQIPILPIAADLMWIAPEKYHALSYPRYNAAIQTQLWGVARNNFIEWLFPLMDVSEIVKFHHFPVPSRESVTHFEECLYFLSNLGNAATVNGRIIQSLQKVVGFRNHLAEIMKIWWEIWEDVDSYTDTDQAREKFPSLEYLEILHDKSERLIYGYEDVKKQTAAFFTADSNQIRADQFEELFSKYPRYILPPVLKEIPDRLKKVQNHLEDFFLFFMKNGIGL